MSITNGQTITKTDLDALGTTALTAIRADNARSPLGHFVNFSFAGLVAATAAHARRAIFVMPFDGLAEQVKVYGSDHNGAAVVTLEGDGVVARFPIRIAHGGGTGVQKTSGPLYDGTKGALGDFANVSRAVRGWNQGATITLTVSTAYATATSHLQVCVLLRSYFGRAR